MHFRTGDKHFKRTHILLISKVYSSIINIFNSAQNIHFFVFLGRPVTKLIILSLKTSDRLIFRLTQKHRLSPNFIPAIKRRYLQKKSSYRRSHPLFSSQPFFSIKPIKLLLSKTKSLLYQPLSRLYQLATTTTIRHTSFISQIPSNLTSLLTRISHKLIFFASSFLSLHRLLTLKLISTLPACIKILHSQLKSSPQTISQNIKTHRPAFLQQLLPFTQSGLSRFNTFLDQLRSNIDLSLQLPHQLYHQLLHRLSQPHSLLHSHSSQLKLLAQTTTLKLKLNLVQVIFFLHSLTSIILTHALHFVSNLLSSSLHLFRTFAFNLNRHQAQTKNRLSSLKHQLAQSKPIRFFSHLNHQTHLFLTRHHQLRLRYLTTLFLISLATTLTYSFYHQIIRNLPDPAQLALRTPPLNTKIYDRNGNLLYKLYKKESRSLITLDEVPLHLRHATIAIEDQEFYQHPGISFRGIARALKTNLTQTGFQGGSTITQQLIKNTLLTRERTLTRKLKEAILSVLTEFYFTKDQILTMYLNQVPYGGTAYGVEEAAQMYFNKKAKDLNLAESAFLAGLPAAPTTYSPYGTNPSLAKSRQLQVLSRMVEDGYITQKEADLAAQQPLNISPHQNPILAPHFVMYVKDLLVKKYGLRRVEQGGLEIITSLDLKLQNQVQKLVQEEVAHLANLNVTNGAALVTHPPTGEILAMVGSVNYFDTQNDGQVNVTLRPRQPGSSIKPINYAMALDNGFTPSTIIPDTPICYQIPGQKPYCPKNYDNRFHGKVTLRKALANSYNVPAVKTLFQFGVNRLIEYGHKLGITTWNNPDRFGLALTLGGGEVKMIDLAVAYGTFANQGLRVDPNPILQIKDPSGQIIEQHCTNPNLSPNPLIKTSPLDCPTTRVLDPRVAFQITDILADNQARASAFGTHSVLNIDGQQVAVKTGTTNNLRDNWTIGYTSDFLVATWVGNNNNTSMSYIASGITGASPIWNKIISTLTDPQHPHRFTPPVNLAKVPICPLTGTLACNGCPVKEEYFIPGTEPKYHCHQDQIARILNPQPQPN